MPTAAFKGVGQWDRVVGIFTRASEIFLRSSEPFFVTRLGFRRSVAETYPASPAL